MRFSNNLGLIIKIIEKVSNIYARDFIELENLQSSPISAAKFANSSYLKAKKTLFDELSFARPDYNLRFSDGEKVSRENNQGYEFNIVTIDGLENLSRANPNFTIAIALKKDQEVICLAIKKIIGSEIYSCEKNIGAYLNNRRIRIAKKSKNLPVILAGDNQKKITDKFSADKTTYLSLGSKLLEIAYLASNKIDHIFYENGQEIADFLLLIKEAGGSSKIEKSSIFITQ